MYNMTLKLTQYFYLLIEKLFDCYFPNLVSLLGFLVPPENNYSHILKETDQVWKSQKLISININHS